MPEVRRLFTRANAPHAYPSRAVPEPTKQSPAPAVTNGHGDGAHCVYEKVARLLTEEPQLEAVAFQPKNQLLSIATLGDDAGHRIGDRVREAVADRERQCGVLDARGNCE